MGEPGVQLIKGVLELTQAQQCTLQLVLLENTVLSVKYHYDETVYIFFI